MIHRSLLQQLAVTENTSMKRVTRQPRDRGMFIVLFVIVMFALLALIALALGLGLVATSSTKLQQAVNLASLGAIKNYIDRRAENPQPTTLELANSARLRANQVLAENRLLFTSGDLGDLRLAGEADGDDVGGLIEPGSYFVEDPDGPGTLDPCTGSYPCFLPVDSTTYAPINPLFPVNAMRVLAKNQANNPMLAPIARIIGQEEVRLASVSTASLAQRCTAYVLDVSVSTTSESHLLPAGDLNDASVTRAWNSVPASPWQECDLPLPYVYQDTPGRVLCPNGAAFFAMLTKDLQLSAFTYPDPHNTATNAAACRGSTSVSNGSANNSGLVWCNLSFQNGAAVDKGTLYPMTPGGPAVTVPHYRQDYIDRPSPYGIVRVDHVTQPEPLASFLTAFNAGLRLVQLQTTGADGAMVVPFTQNPQAVFPPDSLPVADRISRDLSFLVQVTNKDNRGTISAWGSSDPFRPVTSPAWDSTQPIGFGYGLVPSELHPNYIDMGWFPVDKPGNRDTDIVQAIKYAADRLANVTICPATAQKSIILATDGLMTCDFDPVTNVQSCPAPKTYPNYLSAVTRLVGNNPSSIRNQLIRDRIALTVLLRGDFVQPNFRYVPALGGTGFASLREVWAQSTRDEAAAKSLVDWSQVNGFSEADAYEHVGEPNASGDPRIFRDPNWVFTFLSLDTGGLPCPMLNKCQFNTDCPGCITGSSCYDSATKMLRTDCGAWPSTFRCSPMDLDPAEQAAWCVQKTVGGNPYILVNLP